MDNNYSSFAHHLGADPLHFDDLYYEYAAEAIKFIVKKECNFPFEERNKLIEREMFF